MRPRHLLRRGTATIALLTVGVLTACGDDGDPAPAEADPATTTTAEVFDPGAGNSTDETSADDEVIDVDDELAAVFNALVQEATALPGDDDPGSTSRIEDVTGTLAFDAPDSWSDVLEQTDERPTPYLAASPDFESFADSWDDPAIAYYETGLQEATSRDAYDAFVGGTADETGNLVLDECDEVFDRTWQQGDLDLTLAYFDDCGGTTTDFAITWIVPEDGPVLAVDAQLVEQADLVALSLALDSLEHHGEST
jgi:hypothetical protein